MRSGIVGIGNEDVLQGGFGATFHIGFSFREAERSRRKGREREFTLRKGGNFILVFWCGNQQGAEEREWKKK